MSSPFKFFRKNSKVMMASLTILVMISFGVCSSFDGGRSLLPGQADGNGVVMATTTFGNITDTAIVHLRRQRSLAQGFLAQSVYTARMKSEEASQRQGAEQAARQAASMFGNTTDRSLVDAWILDRQAAQFGIVISDSVVLAFLKGMTEDYLTRDEYQAIASRFQGVTNQTANLSDAYHAIRFELAIGNAQRMLFERSSDQFSPIEQFEYFERLHRQAKVELLPISLDRFVDQVKPPSNADLLSFFEQYKNEEPEPGSPEPGFKVPHKVEVAYIAANYEKFVDPAKVTDTAIAEYYEKNKDSRYLYSRLDDDPEGDKKRQADAEKKAEEEKKSTNKPTDSKPPANSTPAPKEDKPVETKPASKPVPVAPRDDVKPEEKAGATKSVPVAPRDEVQPEGACVLAEDDPAKTDAAKDDSAPPTKESTAAKESTATSKEPVTATKTTPETKPAADSKSAPGTAPVLNPAQNAPTPPVVTNPPIVTIPPEATAPFTPPKKEVEPPLPLVERFKVERDIREGTNPKYDPLWKVRDQIRNEIAGEQARKTIDEVIKKVEGELNKYSADRDDWRIEQQDQVSSDKSKSAKALPEPPMPDFAALCKAEGAKVGAPEGLTFGRTGMLSAFEISRFPGLGESIVAQRETFVMYAFRRARVNGVSTAQDIGGNQYAFIKLNDRRAYVPTLEEVRSEVEMTWKRRQARELLRKFADEQADKARQSGKPLKGLLSDDKSAPILEPPTFSWLTQGASGGFGRNAPPRLSNVDGVIDGGDEFMRGIFALETPGDVGVTLNQPQTMAYVVRVESFTPSTRELQDQFRRHMEVFGRADFRRFIPTEVDQASQSDIERQYRDWYKRHLESVALKWQHEPMGDGNDDF